MTSEVGSEVVGEAVEDMSRDYKQNYSRIQYEKKKCIIFAGAQSVRWSERRTGKSTWCATGAPHRILPVRQCSGALASRGGTSPNFSGFELIEPSNFEPRAGPGLGPFSKVEPRA